MAIELGIHIDPPDQTVVVVPEPGSGQSADDHHWEQVASGSTLPSEGELDALVTKSE